MKFVIIEKDMFRSSKIIFRIIIIDKNIYNVNKLPYKNRFINGLKSFSNVVQPQKNDEVEVCKSHELKSKLGQKGSVKVLQELLGLKLLAAKDVVLNYKTFCKLSRNIVEQNYEWLLNNGVTIETIQKFPEVLVETNIPTRIIELKKLPYDINITVPLLSLPNKLLIICVKRESETNRIAIISELLKVEKSTVCKILSRRTFLLSLNLDQLSDNINLLTGNGITKEEIIKDLWVLRYSTNKIAERLDLAKRNNVDVFKTWMVRAQPDIFETYIRRRSDNKSILGDSSLTQYLSERLECTEEVAKYIISKQPALQNKSLKKMNEMIDYLLKYGFKPIHICRVPKILLHSVDTTRQRLRELDAKGIHLDSLYILTKSQKQYMQYCELLDKTSKNKIKNT